MTATKENRFERWLVVIAERLKAADLTCHLAYDDRHLGDRLALAVTTAHGLCELQVHRHERGAALVLVTETHEALLAFVEGLGAMHRDVRRLDNAKRKFVHRVERMARQLAMTNRQRREGYPDEALESLRSTAPNAIAMVGLEALFRLDNHEPDAVAFDAPDLPPAEAREARRYPTRHAAAVDTPSGRRALLYHPTTASFGNRRVSLPPESSALPPLAGAASAGVAAAAAAATGSVEERKREGGDTVEVLETVGDVAEIAIDNADAASGCVDCGGIDVPDLDCIDVPDCGGCDCG